MTTVAVLSGRERRRRWTSVEKRRIVEESFEAETSVAAVARRHDLHPNLLHLWRRQARDGVLGGEPAGRAAADGGAAFAAVTVAPAAMLALPAQSAAAGAIEIEFASGTRLRVTGAVDAATVSAVIAAVAGVRR